MNPTLAGNAKDCFCLVLVLVDCMLDVRTARISPVAPRPASPGVSLARQIPRGRHTTYIVLLCEITLLFFSFLLKPFFLFFFLSLLSVLPPPSRLTVRIAFDFCFRFLFRIFFYSVDTFFFAFSTLLWVLLFTICCSKYFLIGEEKK